MPQGGSSIGIPRKHFFNDHRATGLPNDPDLLPVTSKHFTEQRKVIWGYGVSMWLRQMVESLKDGKIFRRARRHVRRGYADNLYNAKRLVERNDMPATIYVTSGHIGHPGKFW